MKKVLFVLGLMAMVLWTASAAGANVITDVAINCDHVTVSWEDFPSAGIPLHIAVQVGNVGSTNADVSAADEGSTEISIATLTEQLHGDTASVMVDSTWHFFRDHSDHAEESVTCGSPVTTTTTTTTTTFPTTTTTTTVPPTTTTTQPPSITTTTVPPSTTTTAPPASTSTSAPTTTSTTMPPVTTTTMPPTPLPPTGSKSGPAALIGLSFVAGGVGLIAKSKRLAHR